MRPQIPLLVRTPFKLPTLQKCWSWPCMMMSLHKSLLWLYLQRMENCLVATVLAQTLSLMAAKYLSKQSYCSAHPSSQPDHACLLLCRQVLPVQCLPVLF